MLYLITGEWIEDPTVSLQEYATLWDQMVRPSLEALSNMVDEKKTGGVFAGQRAGVLILDVSSHEEVGRFLASLPFFSRIKWNVTPLQSYRSTIERDSKALGGKG
ncbi:MAG TPA: muconolactone Delta-isomerase family protein [Nitrososphaeraceae archaeon]|nr:muconolactone Delta-isomerase family protein [Nitrososphaeraceae archaeon]